MKTGGTVIIVIALTMLCSSVRAADSAGVDSKCYKGIDTPEQALAWAYEWTGFGEIKMIPSDDIGGIARVITATDTRIPYLYEWVQGRRVWELRLKDIHLLLADGTRAQLSETNPKDFIVLLDSITGQFITAYSEYNGSKTPPPLEPTGEQATGAMKRIKEAWTGFLECPPPVNLLEAMKKAVGARPSVAKAVTAVCVIMKDGDTPRAVWSIVGRGVSEPEIPGPPRPSRTAEGDPERQRDDDPLTHVRTLVDAETGLPISVSNRPLLQLPQDSGRDWDK